MMSDTIGGVKNMFGNSLEVTKFLNGVYNALKMTHSNRSKSSPPGPCNTNTFKNSNFIGVWPLDKVKSIHIERPSPSCIQNLPASKLIVHFFPVQLYHALVSVCNFPSSSPSSSSSIKMTWTREREWFYLQISCYFNGEVIKKQRGVQVERSVFLNHCHSLMRIMLLVRANLAYSAILFSMSGNNLLNCCWMSGHVQTWNFSGPSGPAVL